MIPSAVFVPAVELQTNIFTFQQIFEKSWEYAKYVYACFVDFEQADNRVPREKFWCRGRTVLTATGHQPSTYCLPSQIYVNVGGFKLQTVHRGCWTPMRVCAVTTHLQSINYMTLIDNHSRINKDAAVETAVSHICFLPTIWCC